MIITVSRQMGSLGSQVAEETARLLGYKMVARQLINQAALRAGVPEMALATIDELGIFGLKPSRNDILAYHRSVRQVLFEIAREGNTVIVGRAGQVILQDIPGVLHIRVVAPRDIRIARLASDQGLSLETAGAMVERSDRTRTEYLKRYYHTDVNNPQLYDLIINMNHLGINAAARLVCGLVESTEHAV
jgi:cytidylate kinase